MLGKTAGGLFWMFRYLERSENTARLVEAGFRIAITRSDSAEDEWASVITTAGVRDAYKERYDEFDAPNVIDFLLRDRGNPSSVLSIIEAARNNARLVRTALTREVWEATNECWMTLKTLLSRTLNETELPAVLSAIRQQSALVRGAMHGTMLRNEIYDFARIGTFLERADATARILDVKYYVLLPSGSPVGSALDNAQWETILRSVSAQRAYRWMNDGNPNAMGIANMLILDRRLPRSLAFCYLKLRDNLHQLEEDYGSRLPCHDTVDAMHADLSSRSIQSILDFGLHDFIKDFLLANQTLGAQIENDYRFLG